MMTSLGQIVCARWSRIQPRLQNNILYSVCVILTLVVLYTPTNAEHTDKANFRKVVLFFFSKCQMCFNKFYFNRTFCLHL